MAYLPCTTDNTMSVSSIGGASGAYTYRLQVNEKSYSSETNSGVYDIIFSVKGNNGYGYTNWRDEDGTFRVTTDNGFSQYYNSTLTGNRTVSAGSYTTIATASNVTLSHKEDGSLNITASVYYGFSGVSETYVPRASTITKTFIATIIPLQPMVYIKASNVWKKGKMYVKINGVWKKAKKLFIKVGGVWKESPLKG